MNKEITLEEYVLTNLHPGDWGYYIRLNDNIEYQVYKRKPRGQKLYYFIKKDNEEIRLDEEVRKCFLQSKREYERYRNMKNYFKEAKMLSNNISPTKKLDIDNIVKIVLDGMNKFAFKDDTQVIKLEVEKKYAEKPRMYIKIEEY